MKVDISLDLYRIFCTVVSSGNMSKAAKELYISQPAVSMAIRQLENRLGNPLLVRTPKGVIPTAEGKVLYTNLKQALGLIQVAQDKYFQMIDMEVGELKIGGSDTVIANFLLPYLEKYHKLYPEINIKVTNKTTYESLKLLKDGSVDVCFINLPIIEDEEFEIIECKEIQDVLISGEKYKYLVEKGIQLKEIGNYPLLLLEDLSNSRRYIDQYAKANGIQLHPILELGSSDLLVSFAKINLGLTYVIKEFTKELEGDMGVYEIPVIPAIPKRSIGMVRLKNMTPPYALKGFIELIKNKD